MTSSSSAAVRGRGPGVDAGGDGELGLMLNEAKTSVKDARTERFDFLGYTFGPQRYRKDGHWYLGASPSKKSVQRIKTKVGDILVSGNKEPWPKVCHRLNRLLLGWSAYSATARECRPIGRSTTTSMIAFVRSSPAAQGARARHEAVLRRSGLRRVRRAAASTRASWAAAVCLAMKPVGKPDAGNPHVRFDERGRETGRCHMAQATAPVLDSTGLG